MNDLLEEDKRAEIALDPDSTIVNSVTSQITFTKKEKVVYLKNYTEMHHIRYVHVREK